MMPHVPCRRLGATSLLAALALLTLFITDGARVQSAAEAKSNGTLELRKGERICLVGNALADRMQHDGCLEAYFQTRYPTLELSFRNLGYVGDEAAGYGDKPDGNRRLRSAAFGSGDQWLSMCKADVIFAFFGYNESFAGEAGVEKFKGDLTSFITHAQGKQYNGKSAPRIVLFSPIAHENLRSPNLPDGTANNKRLELYTKAMAEVAKASGVVFVDLFHPTQDLYPKCEAPLTINGIHLTAQGNEKLGQIIDQSLFKSDVNRDPAILEKVRAAVAEKDLLWFERYRTVDGFSIYGGRADLSFVDRQTNRVVAQREMEVLDVMTANRDKVVQAAAQGKAIQIDDNNTPPFLPVKTNKPGPLAGGAHVFLNGDDAIKKMKIAPGLKVELWASEKEFPELSKPVQMAFDTKGRMWVAAWPTYPHWKPKEPMNDKLLILEDTKGAGKADRCTVFADDLHCPTGFEFTSGGVLIAQAPDIMLLKDTKGTGKADYRERVLMGMDSADTHHTSNSFALDPGGAVYWQEGTFHHTQVETPYGPPQRCANAGVFRYEPRTQKFEVYVTHGFANPHGHVFDKWGQDIVVDGTGAQPYHAALFSGFMPYPQKHGHPPQVYRQRTRPCPGMEYLYSKHFPEDYWGNLLVANVIGFQGILRYKIEDSGASIKGTELEPILSSSDPNFRPSDLKVGPDGAIYFLDWQNPIIGHMQHNLRDPSRDRVHGRIYRITCENRPPSKPAKIDGEPIEKLLDLLKEPEDRVRHRARIELGQRDSEQVVAAAKKWVDGLDKTDRSHEHHVLEALWLHQNHNVVNVDLLKRVLASPDFHARTAAVRVLCYWRDRVPEALPLLLKAAADDSPRVRLEAIRAASFFTVPEAIEVVYVANEKPSDQYLDFTRGETLKVLDKIFKDAVASGREIKFATPAGLRLVLGNITIEKLLDMKREPGDKKELIRFVNQELLLRPEVRDEVRRDALRDLAKLDSRSELAILMDAIHQIDEKKVDRKEAVVFDLVRMLTGRNAKELGEVRSEIEKLALTAKQSVIRQIGFVMLINIDRDIDAAWKLGMKSLPALADLVGATPLIGDTGLRASMYPRIEPLLAALPPELAGGADGKSTLGRYVRVELPGKARALTLAEVEVYSDGQNVARQGKATQSSVSNGGGPGKAIDGNTSGAYADGGQTHTAENGDNPWWEVDLGAEYPIQSIVIYNRTDGKLGERLNGYTLKVIAKDHKTVVYSSAKNRAPSVSAKHSVGTSDDRRLVRQAAMNALPSVRGQELKTFQTLAKFVKDDASRGDAVHALQRVPRQFWPKDEAKPLVETLLGYIRKVPVEERNKPEALEAMEFVDALSTLLPAEEAKQARTELGELGVRVVRLGTLPERMSYDRDVLVVKAGKPIEILFENFDLMPHNLVITQPGALEEIGMAAENTATAPDAAMRQYVPKSDKILLKSNLLQPREVTRISFTAPKEPGIYPIVCTFPGHWRRMYAALYVVADLDAYLANSDEYLAKNPLTAKDALLKDRRPRTEWKFEDADLQTAVMEMEKTSGRNYNNGKLMFEVATCISCHKFNNVGKEFGPDLLKIDPKQQSPLEILHDILEPSFRINEKYYQYSFELKSGKPIVAMVVSRTPGGDYEVIENPLAKAETRIIKKSDLDGEPIKSKVSMMPKGLLDKLSREEILDLVAYVASKGEPKHRLFQGMGHGH